MDVELPHTFGPADVQTFAALSGDDNPIHLDNDYASKQVIKREQWGGKGGGGLGREERRMKNGHPRVS